ncbi:MAG TPA: 2,3-bisphosphoglycerate-independent phosphoglycerate mutase [Candidatus Dormibacteraeota bacterium]|nr:2,3-bisphosphoglycerate-independent phosphoglycerate mutase [Candidatus Dormibacteraeota bacterium]
MTYRPVVLAILDGWGCRSDSHGNAIAAAALPYWRGLLERYPHTTLDASGEQVGLPKGIMGNSEVGHLNLGAGRVVPQGVTLIDEDIARGEFAKNPTLQAVLAHVRRTGGTLHLMGLLSDGCVHSAIAHLFALADAAVAASVPFVVDAFLDGRDVPPRSALQYAAQLDARLAKIGRPAAIATICGRFYAMDRDKRPERTQAAFAMLARGVAEFRAPDAATAIRNAYARDESDEFVRPTIVGEPRPVRDGDACIFFNFRPDRARQLTTLFNEALATGSWRDGLFATMTKYDETYPNPVLFGPRPQLDTFGDVLSRAGLRQLRLAETEKYAHVTYFFNGGREQPLPGEDRELIPSDRSVQTYDRAPAMRAREITDYALQAIASGTYDAIVMNYANADMVGHTGAWKPTVEAVEFLDTQLARLGPAAIDAGGLLAITADHGNAEEKIDAAGNPLTAHTTNRVPFVLVAANLDVHLASGGKLGDVAPTLLSLMGLPIPRAMTGTNLLTRVEGYRR